MPGPSTTNICSTNATCWYDWSRDCAVKITLGSSVLTSQTYCTLLDGARVYIFGDGSTWTTHDFTYHADDEEMTIGQYEEDYKEEDNGEEKEEGA